LCAGHQPKRHTVLPASRFRTVSDLVLIEATVTDDRGQPITGLAPSSFEVRDAGHKQKLLSLNQGDMPVSIVLVLDNSSSMRRLADRTAEAAVLLLDDPNPRDQFSLVAFSDRPWLAVDWTTDTSKIRDGLARMQDNGNTALLDSIVFAGSVARRAANARRIVVVISDGIDNHSRRSISEVIKYLLEANVQVYAVQLNSSGLYNATPWDQGELLDPICKAGGGRAIYLDNSANMATAVKAVAREIRSEYILGYRPVFLSDPGKYHRVELRVLHPAGVHKLWLSWRHGYYEPDTRP
jgi:Ca-activated chloride channel family protein